MACMDTIVLKNADIVEITFRAIKQLVFVKMVVLQGGSEIHVTLNADKELMVTIAN